MAANDLKASLTLNSTQYETALARADAKATAFANKVQGDLSKKIGKMFGAGALAGALFKPLNDLREGFFGGGNRAKSIKEEADRIKLTGEEYQMATAAARAHNMTVEEWLSKMKESKTPLTKIIEEMQRFRSEVKFTDEQLKNLTDRSFLDWVESVGNGLSRLISEGIEGMANAFARAAVFWNDPDKWKHPLEARKRAFAAVESDVKAQDLNKAAEAPSAGLAAAIASTPKTIRGVAAPGINELQKIGANVGGGNPSQAALNMIAQNTRKSADKLEVIAEKVKKREPVSILDILDSL